MENLIKLAQDAIEVSKSKILTLEQEKLEAVTTYSAAIRAEVMKIAGLESDISQLTGQQEGAIQNVIPFDNIKKTKKVTKFISIEEYHYILSEKFKSNKELAEILNVSSSVISDVRNGKHKFSRMLKKTA